MASWKELCFGNENTVVLVMDLLTDLGSLHFSGFLFPSSGKKKKKKKKNGGRIVGKSLMANPQGLFKL